MKMNLVWLYPDILNLHGDRGNVMAFKKIAEAMDIELNILKVSTYKDVPDFFGVDVVYMGAGQLRDLKYVAEDMAHYSDQLKTYVEEDGFVLCTGSTGCILGKETKLVNGDSIPSLGILDMTATELNRTKSPMLTKEVYGDDIYWKTSDGLEIAGCQIQRFDFKLKSTKPFGSLLYGYGNNCTDPVEGARYKNVCFTNTVGPLLASNPWLGVRLIKDAAKRKGKNVPDPGDNLSFMEYAKEGLALKKNFIREKNKQDGIINNPF